MEVAASTQRREASAVYNCHGMTFAGRRTGIQDSRTVDLILADDGYGDIQDRAVLPGDIVLYYDREGLTHSGVVVSNVILGATPGIRVLSKWGRAGEYIHDLNTHPYRGVTRVRFLREESDAR